MQNRQTVPKVSGSRRVGENGQIVRKPEKIHQELLEKRKGRGAGCDGPVTETTR